MSDAVVIVTAAKAWRSRRETDYENVPNDDDDDNDGDNNDGVINNDHDDDIEKS